MCTIMNCGNKPQNHSIRPLLFILWSHAVACTNGPWSIDSMQYRYLSMCSNIFVILLDGSNVYQYDSLQTHSKWPSLLRSQDQSHGWTTGQSWLGPTSGPTVGPIADPIRGQLQGQLLSQLGDSSSAKCRTNCWSNSGMTPGLTVGPIAELIGG